jgi:hypothetical protein
VKIRLAQWFSEEEVFTCGGRRLTRTRLKVLVGGGEWCSGLSPACSMQAVMVVGWRALC